MSSVDETTWQRALQRLPALPVAEVLALAAAEWGGAAVPLLTLHTRNGATFRGHVVRCEAGHALLAPVAGRGWVERSAVYLPVEDVAAVSVHNFEATAHLFSGGQLTEPVGLATPSRPELESRLHALESHLEEASALDIELSVHWDHLDLDQAEIRRALHRTLEVLTDVWARVCADAAGQRAIAEQVRTVELAHGDHVTLSEGVLRIGVHPDHPAELSALQAHVDALL